MTSPDLVVHAVVEAMFNFKCVISITPSAFGTNFDMYFYLQIEGSGGETVGEITKQWRGCCAESFTDTDTFQVEFPAGSDVTTKAILMGSLMLVVMHSILQPF